MGERVNFSRLPKSLVVNFRGETYVIPNDDPRYADVSLAYDEDRLEEIPDLVNIQKRFSDVENGLEFKDNAIYIDGEEIPEQLANRITEFKNNGHKYAYLMEFAKKLKANESFNSRQMLYKFLEHNGHPITTEGNFIAYRGVTANFRDRHSGKFDNSVGAVCEMPRHLVDDNPNNTCSNGLHVACHDYAYNWASGGPVVEVEVDPRDVVAVPTDYNGTKMRVSKFKVVNICQSMRTEALYRHDESDELDEYDEDVEDWEEDDESALYSWDEA